MSAPYTGRCACGAVEVTFAGEPVATRQCWCRQCQVISSGNASTNAIFKVADATITGELGQSAWTASTGNTLTHMFCPSCGTQVYGQSSGRQHLMAVRFGILDEGHGLRPQAAIWTQDAPDWATFDPELERWPANPASPSLPPAD